MTEQEDEQKFCLEIAEFPGADMPWLTEKARAIEEAMGERLPGMFLWHSVVAHPEIDGIRVFFQIDPAATESTKRCPGHSSTSSGRSPATICQARTPSRRSVRSPPDHPAKVMDWLRPTDRGAMLGLTGAGT